jgi:hypothetical protein
VKVNLSTFFKVAEKPLVFCSDAPIPPAIFGQLVRQFPLDEMLAQMGSGYFSEIDSARHPALFAQITRRFPVWKHLFREVSSNNFKRSLTARFESELVEIRGEAQVRGLRLSDTEIKCSFHLSRNGYLLSPHTDTGMKMITIVFYLHDEGDEIKGAGTRFYSAREPSAGLEYLRGLLDDENLLELDRPFGVVGAGVERVYQVSDRTVQVMNEVRRFDMIHDCILEVPFVGNRAVLFVKSNESWHDVRLESLDEHQLRKSFVVNFSIVPQNQRNLKARIRRRLHSWIPS